MTWAAGEAQQEAVSAEQAKRLAGQFSAALKSEVPIDGNALAMAVADLASTVIVSWPAEVREPQLESFFQMISRMAAQKLAQLQVAAEEAEAAKDSGRPAH